MHAYKTFTLHGQEYGYYALSALDADLSALPYSIRILLESVLRNCNGSDITETDVQNLAQGKTCEVPFKPARVILQDFTGVPAVVDLAAMRSAMHRLGGDPDKINPLIPVDLVIDHSVQCDYAGTIDALHKNVSLEFQRNAERYALLHWAQKSLNNFRVIPPSVGIIHQVNLEYLADVICCKHKDKKAEAEPVLRDTATSAPLIVYPDSVLGTDSHTVMINGLGVLGWGVGGIEAEAVMLGQAYNMLAPEVIGVELTGKLRSGITAADIVLTVTEILRKEGVVGKFVEYFGTGAEMMPVADRAVLANMAPEYGATMGFFPVDAMTLQFLRETGRAQKTVDLVETYYKTQGLFRSAGQPVPQYAKVLPLNLAEVEACVAGPKRPQDRLPLNKMGNKKSGADVNGIADNSVVIAAITSCTNTSNPQLMITAGLLAKKAVEKGLKVPPFVKTSLAPGSRVVTDYLDKAGLLEPLQTLGFHVAGYGCMTCIGNSGPLLPEAEKAIIEKNLTAAAVLSGNRNFEGRVHPLVKANYLAGPPLVVAFALAGTVNIDLTTQPIGKAANGQDVYLKDIFPADAEIAAAVQSSVNAETYHRRYENVFSANAQWNGIPTAESKLFDWNTESTYIQEPPFFADTGSRSVETCLLPCRCLAVLGDSVTTDHISPAGAIKPDSPAGKYLQSLGVLPQDFNSYGSRRGNDRVMTRGTFANIRIRNKIVPETEGGYTKYFPMGAALPLGETLPIYDAAMKYKADGTPLIILAGKEYGTGSSRDWAAKGTALLGVRAVIAESFERIHRGNLVGMGVLPLEFLHGANSESLRLTGGEEFVLPKIDKDFQLGSELSVTAACPVQINGRAMLSETEFKVRVRIDTPAELQCYLNGGILPTVLEKIMQTERR
ncbi:MAG: aconitate hydratase AcnA [Planctomycetaceae bacterium]|jgi:aconitate hydratase|nr:aconitate hydratase AcnA [Planctomycetaceae bacterium]